VIGRRNERAWFNEMTAPHPFHYVIECHLKVVLENRACILSKIATHFVINSGANSLSLKQDVNRDVINLYKLSIDGFFI